LFGIKKDGNIFPAEISLSSVQIKGEIFIIAEIRDITERKNIEQKLLKINEELTESNRELESLSYSISHDLRAPLRHIIGFSNKVLNTQGNKIDEEGLRILNKILESSAKMSLLIDELLKFSRIGKADPEKKKINMDELVKDVISELSRIAAAYLINWHTENLPEIVADPSQITIVFQNLLYNTVKYSCIKENPTIRIECKVTDSEYTFLVSDEGIGFNNEYKGKLFGLFNRLHYDDEFEGTGNGLAIVKRIIMKHNGRVWCEGEINKGATFFFAIPKLQ
jgi:light-regulated signal transduction histidine kinase (bacteriophytochrome)